MGQKKEKRNIEDLYEFIKKDVQFFPLTANLEGWWRRKGVSTAGKRTMHLFLAKKLEETLRKYGFDVEVEGDLEVREWSSMGLPKEYDQNVGVVGVLNAGGKEFKVVFKAREPSWKHFYYEREFYINGQKVRKDKFFKELLKESDTFYKLIQLSRKIKQTKTKL